MKHSYETRLLAVRKCLSGQAPHAVGRQLGIADDYVSEWLNLYKLEGESGLQKRPMKRANFEEKCKIVCEIDKKHVPLHVASAKYRVARSTLRCWRHIVRKDGYEALREVKYGRKYASMGRPKKKEPVTELEKLQRENELLRAENAYLKKLRALVTERERLSKKTKP